MRERGRLAELNIGKTKQYVLSELEALRFIHMPLLAADDYVADPAHSEIDGLPPGDSPHTELIGDLIAQTVSAVYPAVLNRQKDV